MSSSPRYDSKKVDPSPLGQPLKFEFSGKSAPNRFLKGAMTERLSSWSPTDLKARGIPSDNLINVYKRWGQGGLGLILTGNIMIYPDQLEAAGNPIIPADAPFSGERFEAFKKLGAAAKAEGSLIVGQVSHPGRQVEERIQKNPVSASDVQLTGEVMGMHFAKPHAASEGEIQEIIEGFAHAAEYLEKAGYDGIQLHSAHGYLLAQFLSQTTNQRTDKYGGSLENRGRLIVEIADAVRSRTSPSFVLGIKLNSVEFQDKGFAPEEAQELVKTLEAHKFDFVELSGGTYESLAFTHKRESTKAREAFFMDFADAIVPSIKKTKTYVTGGFKTVGAMVDALQTVHGVGLARPVCQEPRFGKDVLAGKVTGAIKQRFDEANFGLTNVVAGTQIRQIGKDQEPFDGSNEKSEQGLLTDMKAWMGGLGADEKFEKYGYIDIDSIPAVPYGGVAAS
ncbi:hypothetical protein FH972_022992 [Carpinus fangiana]|uniref:NADH:flavin oxidoreductase/NADH oxidase N-terminal domain-containing protein n=1 Tax=Carpinus fangiana TaxID=176857 RepID=A0A5N6KTW1_9ROSI|nr:hypothetical protein FH972_022992 [Carpinus fangiana]